MDADSVLSVSALNVEENISTHSHTSVKAIGLVNCSFTLRISSEIFLAVLSFSLAIPLSLTHFLFRKKIDGWAEKHFDPVLNFSVVHALLLPSVSIFFGFPVNFPHTLRLIDVSVCGCSYAQRRQ